MTAALIGAQDADEVLSPDFWRWGELHPEIDAVARGSWRTKEPPAIRGTGYCVDALEAAIWAVAGAAEARDAILRAANLGDDADTTAAIAGQLAGARWGVSGLPAEWRDRIVLRERIIAMADRLFAAGSGAGPSATWDHDEAHHAWWVEPGRVLAGEYPGEPQDGWRVRATVDLLVDTGVRTFVDLTEPGELTPYDHHVVTAGEARRLNLRHLRFPIRDLSTLDDHGYDEILDAIRTHAERGAVYVHCWGGVGRTGTVVGCLLADDGHDHDAVLARLGELRAGTRKAHRHCPETDAQRQVIRERVRRRR